MPGILTLLALGLASYRATRVFTKDSLTLAARERLYVWAWDDDGHAEPTARSTVRTYVYELATCSFCLGIWVSASVWALWRWGGDEARGLVAVLAIAGVQAFVSSRSEA